MLSEIRWRAASLEDGVVAQVVVKLGMWDVGALVVSRRSPRAGTRSGNDGERGDPVREEIGMGIGAWTGRREFGVLGNESGGAGGERGRWVVDEEGEGEKGSREVARWRFTRRELRKAIDSSAILYLCSHTNMLRNAPAEVLKPGMRWVTAMALLDVSFNNVLGDV